MERMIIGILAALLAIGSAHAEVVGNLKTIIIQAATSAELDDTVFPAFVAVARSDAPNDLRIGDGLTPGGLRVCPEGVLTNIPKSFPHPIALNGNSIALNGSYAIGAEGPLFYLRSNGSNVVSILAQPEGLGQTIRTEYVNPNILRVLLAVEDTATDPLVEYSASLLNPAWTDCVYSVTSPSTNTMQIDITIPDDDLAGYFRITALTGFRVRFGIPLEAPAISTESITLSGETRTTWPSGATDVSNTAQAVLSSSLESADTNSAASKQYVLDNAGTGDGATYPEVTSGPGEYALIRSVSSDGQTNDSWSIIRGQVSSYINASYTWTTSGVTNKFYAHGTNAQTYTIPAGITQVVVKCFGAGGGGTGANGGTTIQPYSVYPGEILTLRVGLPTTSVVGGWPGGGTGGTYGRGGGGYSAVLSATNIICIAGGGGGNRLNYGAGGAGGGMTGAGGTPSGGAGGTQSAGGGNGSYLQGGNSLFSYGGGGGGGYYGGGGSTADNVGGGGGSGYVSDKYGYTYQGLLTGDADYESGIGVAGGDGMIVILHDAPEEE